MKHDTEARAVKTSLDDELRDEYDETVLQNGFRGKYVGGLKPSSTSTKTGQEEGVTLLDQDAEYPVWTPLNAFEAAATLTQLVEEHESR
ncbi:MAG: hypothetical protein KIT87_24595 [Anaerolineae bacterium]|nr:hypothetical protein [Anaerolineae bacterium]